LVVRKHTKSIERALYRVHAKVAGNRDGRAVVPERKLEVKLSKLRELGGNGG